MLGMKNQLYAFCAVSFGLVWLLAGIFAIRKAVQLWHAKTASSSFQKVISYLLLLISAWFLINLTGMATLVCADRFSAGGWLSALQLITGIRWAGVYFYNPVFLAVFAPFWLLGLFFWLQKLTLARGLFLIAIGSISAPGWESEIIVLVVAAISFFAWFLAVVGLSETAYAAGYPSTGHHRANS